MNNFFYGIFCAIDNNEIKKALGDFSKNTISLLNIIVGGLMLLAGVAIAAILVYYAVKFGHNNVEMAAEAKKRFKAVLLSLVLCLVILSVGMALINAVLTTVGDAPFDVTSKLLWR